MVSLHPIIEILLLSQSRGMPDSLFTLNVKLIKNKHENHSVVFRECHYKKNPIKHKYEKTVNYDIKKHIYDLKD